ncbi:hypothetical protein JQ597_00050 [Bradyrhizobium sp. AUGA SZCCT0177]|uniref:hypothetical protein n=1 Tax=Bradyrhizobium sp. AUGA SZCCT0177 TaxID=2807665 RepID=UPI001BAC426C|nr:hypothetical protein [Bradyrhizobium sp. AUGA SZCCT0177]MBR1280442.1 hypothetical protein [Bradyrhizobium sp. AUGA SZCCT0177]
MDRRSFIRGIVGAGSAYSAFLTPIDAKAQILSAKTRSLLITAPVELTGDWGGMIPNAALQVIERMRAACYDGVRLVSDQQPDRLRVEKRSSGSPAIWLHPAGTTTGWIIVNIGERDWSKLAYQFGHELGHVTANSWRGDAKPRPPSRWLEEALVEAFSLRGLGILADSWSKDPPFKDDSGFGAALAVYRQNIVERYGKLAIEQGNPKNLDIWLKQHRFTMEGQPGLNAFAQAASLRILEEYERNPACIEALGALNRWDGRSALPLEQYFEAWKASCKELKASAELPSQMQRLLGVI